VDVAFDEAEHARSLDDLRGGVKARVPDRLYVLRRQVELSSSSSVVAKVIPHRGVGDVTDHAAVERAHRVGVWRERAVRAVSL
jgi:hypothetical protein